MNVDNASHIRAHGVNGSMRTEAKMVNREIGATLVHHVANNVYLHLQIGKNNKP